MRPGDVLAGISVALVLIPQSLAYADIAGMPPVRGLYAAALVPIAAALFASSPYLQTGPVAITALLTFGALSSIADEGTANYIGLALLLAVVVGVVRILIGLFRWGVIAYLLSQPMLMGFVPAAAILIVAVQIPAALGVAEDGDGVLSDAASALTDLGAWSVEAILMAAAVLGLILYGRRIHRLFPAVLIAVIGGIVFSETSGYTGPTVGEIPSGLPPISVDLPWGQLHELLLAGVVIALVGFVEAASIARTYATEERRAWSSDREFVSQGVANVVSGFSGGFPVGGVLFTQRSE